MDNCTIEFKKVSDDRYEIHRSGEKIGFAVLDIEGSFISQLYIKKEFRRRGLGIELVRFIMETVKLKRSPLFMENGAIRKMSARISAELRRERTDGN